MKLSKLFASLSFALTLTAQAQSNINLSTVTVVAKTITTGATVIAGTNTSRQYIQVQNNDSTRVVFVSTDPAITTTTGVKLTAGQTWAPYKPPSAPVYAIGDAGSNANVTITEGQ